MTIARSLMSRALSVSKAVTNRVTSSHAGPIGMFSWVYKRGLSMPQTMEELHQPCLEAWQKKALSARALIAIILRDQRSPLLRKKLSMSSMRTEDIGRFRVQ